MKPGTRPPATTAVTRNNRSNNPRKNNIIVADPGVPVRSLPQTVHRPRFAHKLALPTPQRPGFATGQVAALLRGPAGRQAGAGKNPNTKRTQSTPRDSPAL